MLPWKLSRTSKPHLLRTEGYASTAIVRSKAQHQLQTGTFPHACQELGRGAGIDRSNLASDLAVGVMHFGFVFGALFLAVVAFVVAESNEEIIANTPHTAVHFASFQSKKKHQIKTAPEPAEAVASSTTVATLPGDNGQAVP
jgi:hypothetical protein